MPSIPRKTPLFDRHLVAGAKVVDFAGWQMPLQYASGVRAEHLAVRGSCGVFDVSHMGRIEISGPRALALLQRMITNDISAISFAPDGPAGAWLGGAQYGLLCRADAGVRDDVFTYRLGQERYLTVTNAANHADDLAWLRAHVAEVDPRGDGVDLVDRSDELAMLAVQGPGARELCASLVDVTIPRDLAFPPARARPRAGRSFLEADGHAGAAPVTLTLEGRIEAASPLALLPPRMRAGRLSLAGVQVLACGTGYTGEDGLELILPAAHAPLVWNALLDAGATPAGLAARDTLRLEACFHLYGNDLTLQRNPIEAGLGWCCVERTGFIGCEAVGVARTDERAQRLAAFEVDGGGIARPGNEVQGGGVVTSGTFSPSLEVGIGLAYLPPAMTAPGTEIEIDVRGKIRKATVREKPFIANRPKR